MLHAKTGPVPVANFRDELRSLASLNHQNVLKVIDAGYLPSTGAGPEIPYLVTDYVSGMTLENAIHHRILEPLLVHHPDTVIDIALQLCAGVEYLHRQGFVHCDIAPKNVFLQGTGPDFQVLVGDLGLARSLRTLSDSEDVYVAGSKDYVPRPVRALLDSVVSGTTFRTFQPEWDLFAVVRTIAAILTSLNPNPRPRRPWQSGLTHLSEKTTHGRFVDERFATIAALRAYIAWLHPVQHRLGEIHELMDRHPGSRTKLLPVEAVTTSARARQILEHEAIVRLKRVPQLLFGSAVFPGGTHSRYEHTLGTYQVARRYLRTMLADETFLAECDTGVVELGLVAAMLSSVFRFPLSNVIHEIKGVDSRAFPSLSRASILSELLQMKNYGAANSELGKLISSGFPNVDMSELVRVLTENGTQRLNSRVAFVHFLLNSSLDARVLDFLRRDALHLGIVTGLLC